MTDTANALTAEIARVYAILNVLYDTHQWQAGPVQTILTSARIALATDSEPLMQLAITRLQVIS